jgi:cysteine synthase
MLVSVQPDSPLHGLEGLKHMASAIVPGIYDPALANLDLGVSTEDAYKFTRRLAAEEGLLVGISSGANLAGAMSVLATGGSAGLKPRPPSTVPQTIAQDGSSTSQALRSMHEVRGKIEGGRGFSPAGPVAVIIFPDGGERYLSERFWDEAD